jgi:hypothetical protein
MKNIFMFPRDRQGGALPLVVVGLISLLLGAASLLGIFYGAITNSVEYNHFHRIAKEVADDPNSHSEEEILNAGEALHDMMKETVDRGATGIGGNTGGGLGVKLLVQGEDALRKVRLQQYIIKITINPADPAPYQTVTVEIEIVNSIEGTEVVYSLVGSDNYKQTDTLITNTAGMVTFSVPGGAEDVIDTFNVAVGDINEKYTYTF